MYYFITQYQSLSFPIPIPFPLFSPLSIPNHPFLLHFSQIVAQILDVPEVKFTKDPPMTAKVTMLNKADMGEDAGEVDLQINVAFVGDEVDNYIIFYFFFSLIYF